MMSYPLLGIANAPLKLTVIHAHFSESVIAALIVMSLTP